MPFGWKERNCMQKFALIVAIVTIVIMAVCLIANIVTTAQAAEQTWFTKCSDCKRFGGDEECGSECCTSCTRKDAIIFYTMRAYSMIFCTMAIVAEIYVFEFFRHLFVIFKYAWGRGLLQIFVGFLTLTGNLAPDDPTAAEIIAGVGWVGILCGVVHLFLSCLCFHEYKAVQEDHDKPQAEADSGNGDKQMNASVGPHSPAGQKNEPDHQGNAPATAI